MDKHRETITKSAAETSSIGEEFGRTYLKLIMQGKPLDRPIVCLYGDLGSGKTTFSQGFAKGIGMSQRLLSPTYIIVRRYQIVRKSFTFNHIDLYRVQSEKDLMSLGISDIFSDSQSISLIEWAEKLHSYLPQKRVDITFSISKDENHSIKFSQLQ